MNGNPYYQNTMYGGAMYRPMGQGEYEAQMAAYNAQIAALQAQQRNSGYNVPNPQQQQQQQNIPQQQAPGFTVRPVTGIEEAKAIPVEFGSTNVMLNLGAAEIYVTRINNSGLKDIAIFKMQDDGAATPTAAPIPAQIDLTPIHEKLDNIIKLQGEYNNVKYVSDSASSAKRKSNATDAKSSDV